MGTGGDRLSSGFGTRPCRCERKAAAADFFVSNIPSLCLSRARLGKWHHSSCLHKKTERTKQNKTKQNKTKQIRTSVGFCFLCREALSSGQGMVRQRRGCVATCRRTRTWCWSRCAKNAPSLFVRLLFDETKQTLATVCQDRLGTNEHI